MSKDIQNIISHLRHCAKQNEADARSDSADAAQARAVAAEQRRVIGLLKNILRVNCTISSNESTKPTPAP